jgi:Icc-related predicted phosphoesterase
MRILAIGDFHGKMPKVPKENFDAIISPGDFCSSDKTRKYQFMASRQKMENPKLKVNWYDLVGLKRARKLIRESFNDGRKVLKSLDALGIPVLIVPGNADLARKEDLLVRECNFLDMTKGLKNVVNVNGRIASIGDNDVIGYGIASGPEYPKYKDLERMCHKIRKLKTDYTKTFNTLSKLFKKSTKDKILLSHNTPFRTKLDLVAHKESPRYGYHYGSVIVREIVKKYNPILSIGGHMHEGRGTDRIGKTLAVNPGYGHDGQAAIISLPERKVEFVSI